MNRKKLFKMRNLQVLLLVFILLSACSTPQQSQQSNEITVSIAPQKYFVDAITGGKIKVNVFVPAGASPATYEPSPQQMFSLKKSKCYIALGGLGFELAWLPKLMEQNEDLKIYYVNKGISMAEDEEHGKNPHIWLSAKKAKIMAQNTYDAIVENFPENIDIYKSNFEQLNTEIDSIDQLYTFQLSKLSNKNFMIFHPALYYLADDYGLKQLAIEEHGKSPSPNHLIGIVKQAKELNIHLIFIQKEFDIENAELIAKQTGAKIVQINPLDENWKQQQIVLLQQIVSHLN